MATATANGYQTAMCFRVKVWKSIPGGNLLPDLEHSPANHPDPLHISIGCFLNTEISIALCGVVVQNAASFTSLAFSFKVALSSPDHHARESSLALSVVPVRKFGFRRTFTTRLDFEHVHVSPQIIPPENIGRDNPRLSPTTR